MPATRWARYVRPAIGIRIAGGVATFGSQGRDGQRGFVQRLLEGGLAELGAEPVPRPPGLVQGVAEVPGRRMEWPECGLGGLEVGGGDVQDHPCSLRQLDHAAERVRRVAVAERWRLPSQGTGIVVGLGLRREDEELRRQRHPTNRVRSKESIRLVRAP